MNRIKKIRGHKKIQKKIQNWIEQNRTINISDFLANKYCYTYVSLNPYFNISVNDSNIPEPKKETRKQIILGLQEIYNNWKIELDKLNQPYFLKIYLFEPRISKSQVICAIGKEKIEYYKNFFRIADKDNSLSNFKKIISSDFKWKTHLDDDIYSEQELLSPESYYYSEEDYNYCKKLLKKLQNKNYTKVKTEDEYGKDYLYYVPKGKVFIGGK
ncbi:hypothetical protein [Flavobacterium chungnamense]|uniref:Uncharacterized protein n=1 Tax=Flavobacterium chungnamense TaxID=706182 RepID=A0ABP7V494_9FLAO